MSHNRLNVCSRLISLGLAAALLLPIYGSWINFRYAAQQPTHKHIYLSIVDLDHHRTADTKDVIILPDQDAVAQAVVSVDLPVEQIAANSADTDDLTFQLSDEYLSPENTFLPPPDHPPRI